MIQRFPKQGTNQQAHPRNGAQNSNVVPRNTENRDFPSSESEDESSPKFLLNNAEELRVEKLAGDDHQRALFSQELLMSMFTQACNLDPGNPKQQPISVKKKKRHQNIREIPPKQRQANQERRRCHEVTTASQNLGFTVTTETAAVVPREASGVIPGTKMHSSSQSLNSELNFSDYDEDFTPPRRHHVDNYLHGNHNAPQQPRLATAATADFSSANQDEVKRNLQHRQ